MDASTVLEIDSRRTSIEGGMLDVTLFWSTEKRECMITLVLQTEQGIKPLALVVPEDKGKDCFDHPMLYLTPDAQILTLDGSEDDSEDNSDVA
jgi:hypothetical protein